MKKLLTISISSLLLSFSLNAKANEITCPLASAITEVGINFAVVNYYDHSWQAGLSTHQHYGTNENWKFRLKCHTPPAENEKEAISLATEALSSLKLFMGPIANGKGTVCYYSTNVGDILGIAYTTQ